MDEDALRAEIHVSTHARPVKDARPSSKRLSPKPPNVSTHARPVKDARPEKSIAPNAMWQFQPTRVP